MSDFVASGHQLNEADSLRCKCFMTVDPACFCSAIQAINNANVIFERGESQLEGCNLSFLNAVKAPN